MVKGKLARTAARGSDLARFPDCDGMAELVRTGERGYDRGSIGEAQQLVYDAWEETDRQRRHALARRALTLSPLCADAWLLLSELRNLSVDARREILTRAVCAGRLAIGERTFREDRGNFWLVLETRPYMRARHALAEDLWFSGARQVAIEHLREMLELNPNDNQGLRYTLLSWLLWTGDDDAARRLLRDHGDEVSTYLEFTRLLLAFRQSGDSEVTRAAAERARLANRHVARFLADPRLWVENSGFYSPGRENEATWYALELGFAWRKPPGAVEWLLDQMQHEPIQNREGKTLH
jgi:tetratricopeptide (TPR) repeat protein